MTITINSKNIDKIMGQAIKKLENLKIPKDPLFIFPRYVRGEIDRKKYKGRGRPKNKDYKLIEFKTLLNKDK